MPLLLLLLGAGLGVGGTLIARELAGPTSQWIGFVESSARGFIDGAVFDRELQASAWVSDIVLDTPGAVAWTYELREGEFIPESVRKVTEERGILL